MKNLIERILTCQSCELHESCRNPVPPSAPTTTPPRFLVLGEAPGQYEDRAGKPFMGPAGELLRMELRGAGVDDGEVAYGNVVNCWPKGAPVAHQIEACRKNLQEILRSIRTDYVLVCGQVALEALIPRAQIKYAANTLIPVHNRIFVPVYHPSFILRTGSYMNKEFTGQIRNFVLAVEMGAVSGGSKYCIYCSARKEDGEITCYKHRKFWWGDMLSLYKQKKRSEDVYWEEYTLPGLGD